MNRFFAALLLLAPLWGCDGTPHPTSSFADEILTTSPGGFIRFGPQYFEFTKFVYRESAPDQNGNTLALIATLGETEDYLVVPIVAGGTNAGVKLVSKNSVQSVRNLRNKSVGKETIQFTGRLESGVPVLVVLNVSAGASTFRIEENRAFLQGELGSGTLQQVEYLIHQHPEVDTLVFENVPGSLNDDVNVSTGRLIREAGYTTIVPADGMVASGGVALFAAGLERTVEPGAHVGVHAWSIPGSAINPAQLPRQHEAHSGPRSYFEEMLPNGAAFYFFTLQAAPFAGVHWMTQAEVERFGLNTAAQ
jgi:hypothetical protein